MALGLLHVKRPEGIGTAIKVPYKGPLIMSWFGTVIMMTAGDKW